MKNDDYIPSIIEQADAMTLKVQEAQSLAEIKNAARRHAERMAFFKAWVHPKAIAERKERHERDAFAALAMAHEMSSQARKALGLDEDPPLPDAKDLPPHMRGQSPSTIRAMLRHERSLNMSYKVEIKEPSVTLARVLQIQPKRQTWYQRLLSWINS